MTTRSPSSASACTRGASGAATSSSTASSRRAPRCTTPALEWSDVQFVSGADTIRNGYPGYVAGATFAQALGWQGAPRRQQLRRVRVGRDRAERGPGPDPRRACATSPSCRRRHHAQGLPRPDRGRAGRRSRLAALPPARRDQPDLLRALRPPAHGAVRRDAGRLRQGQGEERTHGLANPNARYRKEVTEDEVMASPVVRRPAAPARHLRDDATAPPRSSSSSIDYARSQRRGRPGAGRRRSRRSRRRYPNTVIEMPNFATDSAAVVPEPALDVPRLDRRRAPTRRPASGPTTSTSPRSTTCRRRSSSTGTRTSGCAGPGEAEQLLHDGDTTHRRPRAREPERRARLLRRGRPRAGARPGVRGHLAAAGPGRRPPGRGRRASGSPSTRACSATAPPSSWCTDAPPDDHGPDVHRRTRRRSAPRPGPGSRPTSRTASPSGDTRDGLRPPPRVGARAVRRPLGGGVVAGEPTAAARPASWSG